MFRDSNAALMVQMVKIISLSKFVKTEHKVPLIGSVIAY